MGAPLNAVAKSTTANSYITVARATTILRRRLYTTPWDNASGSPSATGYTTSGATTAGSASVAITGGTGTFSAGTVVTFAGHDQEYTVLTALTGAGTLAISPSLTEAVASGAEVTRHTASEREQALMWATQLLDAMMVWKGRKTTHTQSLWFPASGLVDENGTAIDYDTVPPMVEVATAELAKHLLTTDVFAQPAALGLGVSEVQIGPLKAKIDSKQQVSAIPENILSLLSQVGALEAEASKGSYVVPLRRV